MNPTLDPDVVNLTKAIRQQESGGDFARKGASGEYGAYQYMPGTWKAYAGEVLGDASAPMDKINQNKVAYNKIKQWKDAGYNVGQIASMWNAGPGKPNAYKEGYAGTNSQGVKYDTPGYAKAVATYYHQFKGETAAPEDSSATIDNTDAPQSKNLLQKVGDFFTGSTQKFGKTAGEAFASGVNTDLQEEETNINKNVLQNIFDAIKKKKALGLDTTRLEHAYKLNSESIPVKEDFSGDVSNKSNEQILGEAAGTLLEATSGGIIGGGVKNATAKGVSLGTKLLKGAGIGAAYGAASGVASGLENDESAGGVAKSGAIGAVAGAALGTAGEGLAIGVNKLGKFVANSTAIDKLLPQTEKRIAARENVVMTARASVANQYEKVLPLTPTQKAREARLFAKTGDNVYSTLAKYDINLGSENALPQLQEIGDQFANATQHSQINEHGYFNLDEMKANAFDQINRNVPSELGRAQAKNKIEDEIAALIKGNKDSVITDVNGQVKVKSDIMERLRRTGNSWTNFDATDPAKIGKSTGYALANAVRDQVEKEGTFPGYREANKEWGKIIHAQEVLGKMEDSGKTFRLPGGLSGAMSRKLLGGAIGYHTGGFGGLILGELGSEYGARLLADPQLRTWFDRKLIATLAEKKPTPEVIATLEQEIRNHLDTQKNVLQLPAGDPSKIAIPMGRPATPPANTFSNDVEQNTKILNNTPQLPAPTERIITPNTQGTPNPTSGTYSPGGDSGEVGGLRQRTQGGFATKKALGAGAAAAGTAIAGEKFNKSETNYQAPTVTKKPENKKTETKSVKEPKKTSEKKLDNKKVADTLMQLESSGGTDKGSADKGEMKWLTGLTKVAIADLKKAGVKAHVNVASRKDVLDASIKFFRLLEKRFPGLTPAEIYVDHYWGGAKNKAERQKKIDHFNEVATS